MHAQALTGINLCFNGILDFFFFFLVLVSSLSSSGLLCIQVEKRRRKSEGMVKACVPGEVPSARGAWAGGCAEPLPKRVLPAFPTEVGPQAVTWNRSNINQISSPVK